MKGFQNWVFQCFGFSGGPASEAAAASSTWGSKRRHKHAQREAAQQSQDSQCADIHTARQVYSQAASTLLSAADLKWDPRLATAYAPIVVQQLSAFLDDATLSALQASQCKPGGNTTRHTVLAAQAAPSPTPLVTCCSVSRHSTASRSGSLFPTIPEEPHCEGDEEGDAPDSLSCSSPGVYITSLSSSSSSPRCTSSSPSPSPSALNHAESLGRSVGGMCVTWHASTGAPEHFSAHPTSSPRTLRPMTDLRNACNLRMLSSPEGLCTLLTSISRVDGSVVVSRSQGSSSAQVLHLKHTAAHALPRTAISRNASARLASGAHGRRNSVAGQHMGSASDCGYAGHLNGHEGNSGGHTSATTQRLMALRAHVK